METCLRALPVLRSLHLESFLLCCSAFTQNAASKAYFHYNIQLSKGSLITVSRSMLHSSDGLHASGRVGATLEGKGDVASPAATLATELLYNSSLMGKPAQAEAAASPTVLTWLHVKILLIKDTLGQLLLPKSMRNSPSHISTHQNSNFFQCCFFKVLPVWFIDLWARCTAVSRVYVSSGHAAWSNNVAKSSHHMLSINK